MNAKSKTGRTVILMMAATLLAKALGVIRTVCIASAYGDGLEASAFNTASLIPLTVFDMLLGAAIPGAFIPAYNRLMTSDGEKRADEFADRFLNMILLLTGALSVIGIAAAPALIHMLSPGLDPSVVPLAVRLLRIMFPLTVFTGAAYTLTGVMQSKERFMLPAFISAISNGGIIIYLLIFDRLLGDRGIYGLAIASALSWLLQLLTLAIPLAHTGDRRFRMSPTKGIRDAELIPAIKSAPPVMIGSWLLPAALQLGVTFASLTDVAGGITDYNYAHHVYILIAGILTYSICNYVFPEMSRLSGSSDAFAGTLRGGLKWSLTITIPFTAAVFILAPCGISLLYLRGEFTAEAAYQTSLALRALTPAMPAFALIEILNRAFYAKNSGKTPMIAALIGIAADAAVTSVLVFSNILPGMVSVAIGACAGQWAAAITLVISAAKNIKGAFDGFLRSILPAVIGTIASAAVMCGVYLMISPNPYTAGTIGNLISCIIIFVPGAAIFCGILLISEKIRKKRGDEA